MESPPEAPKARKKRPTASVRHPLLEGKSKHVWHPECAGVVPRYPKTQEIYDALVERGRKNFAKMRAEGRPVTGVNVPKGWARQGAFLKPLRALAKEEARRFMEYMRKEDLLLEPDNVLANEALLAAVELHRLPETPGPLRLAAARTVLEWTRAKPAQKIDQTIRTPESWLADLSAAALHGKE